MGTNGVVDKCSSAYGAGEWAGIGLGLAFGGAHLGRNALNQIGRRGNLGKGISRLFYDNRTWNSVRSTWSNAAGGLQSAGQSLHHTLIAQRAGLAQGIQNAGFNYLPLTASFNSWMNGSTAARIAVEQGLKVTVLGIYASPITAALNGNGDGCDCAR